MRTLHPATVYVNISPIHTCFELQCSGLLRSGLFIIIFRGNTMCLDFQLETGPDETVLIDVSY